MFELRNAYCMKIRFNIDESYAQDLLRGSSVIFSVQNIERADMR